MHGAVEEILRLAASASSPFTVVGRETDMAGSDVYAIFSERRGHVGYVTVRAGRSRQYQRFDRSLLLLAKPPVFRSAWDEAVDNYREVIRNVPSVC